MEDGLFGLKYSTLYCIADFANIGDITNISTIANIGDIIPVRNVANPENIDVFIELVRPYDDRPSLIRIEGHEIRIRLDGIYQDDPRYLWARFLGYGDKELNISSLDNRLTDFVCSNASYPISSEDIIRIITKLVSVVRNFNEIISNFQFERPSKHH